MVREAIEGADDEGRSSAQREGGTTPVHIWKPRPLLRSIQWIAEQTPGARLGEAAYDVFIMQTVLEELLEHVWSAGRDDVPFGFLIGDLCEDPEADSRYLLVGSVVRSRLPLAEDAPQQVSPEAQIALQLEVERRRGILAGWYHRHAGGAVELSEGDVATHDRLFRRPWQIAVLAVTDPEDPRGGVFRRTSGGFSRTQPCSFYELVRTESLMARGVRRSCLDWNNVRAEETVIREPSPRLVQARKAAAAAERRAGDVEAAGGSAVGGGDAEKKAAKGEAGTSVRDVEEKARARAERAEREEAERKRAQVERERAEREREEQERAERRKKEQERAEREKAERERAEQERAEQERAERQRAERERARRAAEEEARLAARASEERASAGIEAHVASQEGAKAEKSEEEPARAVGTQTAGEPASSPPVRVASRHRRRRRPAWLARVAILAAGVVVVAVVAIGLTAVVRWAGESEPLPFQVGAGATGPAPTAPEAGGEPAEAEPTAGSANPAEERLDRLAGVLAGALESYGELVERTAAGSASCSELQQAYVGVEEAWIDYNVRGRAPLGDELDAQRGARDTRLYEGVQQVERRFGASGCPRP